MGTVTHFPGARSAPTPEPEPIRQRRTFAIQRVRLNTEGYDSQGAYWGVGEPLYVAVGTASSQTGVTLWVRARDREGAKRQVKQAYPGAQFYR